MKNQIAYYALRLFDEKGYHGTTMREIGKAAGCQMPTVYYYFQSKELLFDQVVRINFENLVARLDSEVPKGLSLNETYVQRLINKKTLSEDERLIYRLALKTWLAGDGPESSRQKLLEWEQAAYVNTYKRTMEEISSSVWSTFFIRCFTNIIQRMMLLGEDLSEEGIRQEISMILEVATHHKYE